MPVVVLDVESTGYTGMPKSSVVEVGAVCLSDDGYELSQFSSLVRPTHLLGEWAEGALRVNQLDPVRLAAAPPAAAVWDALLKWMGLNPPVTQVLAYNVTFDKGMMTKTFEGAEHLPWGPCLMRAASERLLGHRKGMKLYEAAEQLQVPRPNGDAHRALFDAVLAGRVWSALL